MVRASLVRPTADTPETYEFETYLFDGTWNTEVVNDIKPRISTKEFSEDREENKRIRLALLTALNQGNAVVITEDKTYTFKGGQPFDPNALTEVEKSYQAQIVHRPTVFPTDLVGAISYRAELLRQLASVDHAVAQGLDAYEAELVKMLEEIKAVRSGLLGGVTPEAVNFDLIHTSIPGLRTQHQHIEAACAILPSQPQAV